MLTEKFFFLQKTSFYVIPAVDYHNNWKEHQSRKKIPVNLEEEKFKSWNKSGRQLKNASKD